MLEQFRRLGAWCVYHPDHSQVGKNKMQRPAFLGARCSMLHPKVCCCSWCKAPCYCCQQKDDASMVPRETDVVCPFLSLMVGGGWGMGYGVDGN